MGSVWPGITKYGQEETSASARRHLLISLDIALGFPLVLGLLRV